MMQQIGEWNTSYLFYFPHKHNTLHFVFFNNNKYSYIDSLKSAYS